MIRNYTVSEAHEYILRTNSQVGEEEVKDLMEKRMSPGEVTNLTCVESDLGGDVWLVKMEFQKIKSA